MTPEKLTKIRALANDARGDPATRAVAQEILKRYAKPSLEKRFKEFKTRLDPRVHGLRRDPTYEYHLYCDLSQWDKTKAGNYTYLLYRNGISYRIVLFKHRRSDTYGWMRVNMSEDDTEFSGRFDTIGEAQRDAWLRTN